MIYSNIFQYGFKIDVKKNRKYFETLIIYNLEENQELELLIYTNKLIKLLTINEKMLKNSKIRLNSQKLIIENKKDIFEIKINKILKNEFQKFFYFITESDLLRNLKNPEVFALKKILLQNEKFKNYLKSFSQLYLTEFVNKKENLWKKNNFLLKKDEFKNIITNFLKRSNFDEIKENDIYKNLNIRKKKFYDEEDFFQIFFSGVFNCEKSLYLNNYQSYKKNLSKFLVKSFFFGEEKISYSEFEKKHFSGFKYFDINLKWNSKKNILETFFFDENNKLLTIYDD